MSVSDNDTRAAETRREAELAQIQEALRGLRFGSVNIVVQDGVVVQIDRIEKRRIRVTNGVAKTGDCR